MDTYTIKTKLLSFGAPAPTCDVIPDATPFAPASPWERLDEVKDKALHIIAPCKESEYNCLCYMLDEGEWVYFSTADLVEILESDRNDSRGWKDLRDKLYNKIALRLSYLWG